MRNIARRQFLIVSLSTAAVVLVAPSGEADTRPAGRRTALRGYDPVSYFTDGRPEKGSDEFWYPFDDAIYLFRNAEHRALFAAEPERYAPQYAGFCAGGVSQGYKTEPDPEAWMVVNGKLFVFQLKERVADFKRDLSFIGKADVNWPGLRDAPIR